LNWDIIASHFFGRTAKSCSTKFFKEKKKNHNSEASTTSTFKRKRTVDINSTTTTIKEIKQHDIITTQHNLKQNNSLLQSLTEENKRLKQLLSSIKQLTFNRLGNASENISLLQTFVRNHSWVGRRVRKVYINKSTPFYGKITDINGVFYQVVFDDGMQENIHEDEIEELLTDE
jgi:hypothetical protein